MRQRMVVAALIAAGCASVSNADVLWDQSALDWNAGGFYNSISGSFPFGATVYTVADVTVPAGGWTVDSVTMYFSQINSDWVTDVSQGRLYIQPKTGALPTALPGGSLVPMSAVSLFDNTVQQSYYAITASGLNSVLAPGEYWIGITPAAPGGPFGPELGIASAAPTGAPSASFDIGFPGWQGVGVDAAILINGSIPAPGTVAALGLAGLFAARRRRA